ncbi:MAG: undecaprenyl-diphosphate phosphatase [Phycisphaerales bacterium]|nr:undecaprenyl-diphosphate phosphatase [Phycisphaerales bacterium]
MDVLQAAVLGLVEGITEFLPVSSTGHLILAAHALGLDDPSEKKFTNTFNIVIQGGAILAVATVYWPRVRQMLLGVVGKNNAGFDLLVKLSVAFLPAGVLGVLLDDWLGEHLFFPGPVIGAVIVGGVFMLLLEQWRLGRFGIGERGLGQNGGKEIEDLSIPQCLFIGCMQCIAMWPGTSRSMMSMAGGLMVGLKPRAAAEFAFLLGLPTLGGATVYKLFKNAIGPKEENIFQSAYLILIAVGMGVSFISALVAVRWLVGFLNKHGLGIFGWYRIVLGLALIAAVYLGWISIEPLPK